MRWQVFILCGVSFVGACFESRAATISGSVTLSASGTAESADILRTVVYLDAHPALVGEPPRDDLRPQIVQRDKSFIPDLLVVAAGTTVEFPNWDPYTHNVFSRSRAAQFDLDRYGQGQSKSYKFSNAGVVQIFCNVHPQMRAVLLVTPNRFVAGVNQRGGFAIPKVPPGRYVLVAWHERGGEVRQEIDVPAEGLRGISIALPANATRQGISSLGVRSEARGVERGLSLKRERLNLPVVGGAHAAPPLRRSR